MRNNETGEVELVVGTRQLLSGFFIDVLLFAVAFAMGYVVGENSRTAKAQTEMAANPPGAPTGESRPQPTSPATSAPATSNPPAASPVTSSESRPPVSAQPQPSTRPAADVPPVTHETPVHEPPAPKREPQRKTEPPAPPRETKAPPPPTVVTPQPIQGPPGSYWQVLATANRDSAQDMVKALQGKGLPASMSPGPNNLMRVVVGPYHDTQALGRAKTELEGAGLHPVRR